MLELSSTSYMIDDSVPEVNIYILIVKTKPNLTCWEGSSVPQTLMQLLDLFMVWTLYVT